MANLQNILDYYNGFPLLIKMAWVISCVLLVAILVLTIVLKTIRASLRKKDEEKIIFRKAYEASLIEYLYWNRGRCIK